MDDMNTLDRERSSARITDEERRLNDEAVAAGRVTRVPTGASAFSRDYIWSSDGRHGMQLVPVKTSGAPKPGDTWRQEFSASAKLARTRKSRNRKAEV